LAALAVVLVHATFTSGFTLRHAVGRFDARLEVGVAVFFLVSGCLLYRPFVGAHLAGRPGPALRPYLRRRLLRIVPAYWLALTVIAFVLHDPAIHGLRQIVIYYGFLQIYFRKFTLGGISQAWSLCTEMTFYLFLPVWAIVVRRVGQRRRVAADRLVVLELAGLGVLYATGVASRVVLLAALTHHAFRGFGWLQALPPNLDLFALGMALAVISAWTAQLPRPAAAAEAAGRRPWVWWVAAAVIFWVVSTQLRLPVDLRPLTPSQSIGRQLLYGLFALLLLVPGVFGPQDRGVIRRLLRNPLVQALGVISYSIYLWHQAAIAEYLKRYHVAPFSGHFRVMLAFTLVATIGAATASYFVLEKPARRLKGKR
jgi:peptidoglycan/LPS O-acetylase OafA/YrhL